MDYAGRVTFSYDAVVSKRERQAGVVDNWPRSQVVDIVGVYMAGCACRKSNPDILVVQPAENWTAKNLPSPFDGARERRILLQG
jgi:hypothetical protein